MKKMILTLVAAVMASTALFAQSSLLATLSHDGTISTYYGATALREAHTDASDGDIITLSSGSFTSVDITKGITIRGAGMDVDATTQSEPTIITGAFSISIPEETTAKLTIEGVYCNQTVSVKKKLTGATFLKSRLYSLSCTAVTENLTMIHCKIAYRLYYSSKGSTLSCLNCIIWTPYFYNGDTNGEFINCVIAKDNVSSYLSNSTFKNCIFVGCLNSTFASSNTMFNCIALNGDTYGMFNNMTNATNKVVNDYAQVFQTCKDGTYSDSENFELTSETATGFMGTDATQVGIYGGSMPFSITPSNPQITKANVAAKSTADGKLSVDITVQGAE